MKETIINLKIIIEELFKKIDEKNKKIDRLEKELNIYKEMEDDRK